VAHNEREGHSMATNDDNGFDPRRRLCPDGSCVGVIGGDGRCSICGASDAGATAPLPSDPLGGQEAQDGDTTENAGDASYSTSDEAASSSGFDPSRRLCADDACIGVIGEDNRCSVCGRPAGP